MVKGKFLIVVVENLLITEEVETGKGVYAY